MTINKSNRFPWASSRDWQKLSEFTNCLAGNFCQWLWRSRETFQALHSTEKLCANK